MYFTRSLVRCAPVRPKSPRLLECYWPLAHHFCPAPHSGRTGLRYRLPFLICLVSRSRCHAVQRRQAQCVPWNSDSLQAHCTHRNSRAAIYRIDAPRRVCAAAAECTRTRGTRRPAAPSPHPYDRQKRDPAVAHAQREAVRRNWNPFAFDVSLNSPYFWGAAACVALVATAYDEAETDEQRRRREEVERRKRCGGEPRGFATERSRNTVHLRILAEVLFGPRLEDDLALLVGPDLRELQGARRRAPRDGAVALVFGTVAWADEALAQRVPGAHEAAEVRALGLEGEGLQGPIFAAQ